MGAARWWWCRTAVVRDEGYLAGHEFRGTVGARFRLETWLKPWELSVVMKELEKESYNGERDLGSRGQEMGHRGRPLRPCMSPWHRSSSALELKLPLSSFCISHDVSFESCWKKWNCLPFFGRCCPGVIFCVSKVTPSTLASSLHRVIAASMYLISGMLDLCFRAIEIECLYVFARCFLGGAL